MLDQFDEVIDITRPLNTSNPAWPGDSPFELKWKWRTEDGEAVNLSRMSMSPHASTHVDAPLHFKTDAPDVLSIDPRRLVGSCLVLDVRPHEQGGSGVIDANILKRALKSQIQTGEDIPSRMLFRTGYQVGEESFNTQFTHFTEEAIEMLADRDVRALGTDAPSVDSFASKDLPAHTACINNDIYIIESLDLSKVDEGKYHLIALPIKIVGAEGAPVRALLGCC